MTQVMMFNILKIFEESGKVKDEKAMKRQENYQKSVLKRPRDSTWRDQKSSLGSHVG